MNITVMNFNRIRDLVSNLGWSGEDHTYVPGNDCLATLQKLEDELLNEDVVSRNVRISLHFCGTVKNDLIPILLFANDAKVLAIATRILVNLSLPMEYLLPLQESQLPTKLRTVQRQVAASLLAIKKYFLDIRATLSLVTTLRETIIKSEKHQTPLKDEDCNHLKNCLTVIRNILHLPEFGMLDKHSALKYAEWQSLQSKLIWNLFVQGIDGALLLMLNSKYRKTWTVPLSLIIALLYKNQSIDNVHQSLEQISSASDSSGDDEESDGSKHSSTSLSSEPSKCIDSLSDSGCPPSSLANYTLKRSNLRQSESATGDCTSTDIHTKLEKVKISDSQFEPKTEDIYMRGEQDSESSSSCDSPYHKKIKGNISSTEIMKNDVCYNNVSDSAISMDLNSAEMVNVKSSDEDICEQATLVKNLEAIQKLKNLQQKLKMSESDSSNEDGHYTKFKYRSHPPTGRRGKSPRRNSGCVPSVCMMSAYEESCVKGRIKYPLWGKRNSVATLVDIHSLTPTDDDIGNLLKDFTLSFIHSGFCLLVGDMQKVLLEGPSFSFDKSLFYWTVSYFLPLAIAANVCLEHISDILSVDLIGYLVFECANACENMELHSKHTEPMMKYLSVNLILLVTALKEVISTVDLYSRKCTATKDRHFFNDLCGKISGLQDIRQIPLLLFRNCSKVNSQTFLEDVVILNHLILIICGRGSTHCSSNTINFAAHLKLFTTRSIIDCYGNVLERFKTNSHFLNDCAFTMLHHLAGDLRSSELFFVPSVLKTFSEMLKEDIELEQYQEDLILYILNKFSLKVYQNKLSEEKSGGNGARCVSPSNSSLSSNCLLSEEDDLFWWYLQFQEDPDPISRISELIPTSKRDILSKLHLKGHISSEKSKQLEEKMKAVQDQNGEVSINECNPNFDDEITLLLRTVVQSGGRPHLIWLQDVLMETCYFKLGVNKYQAEPTTSYSIKMMLSVPLIPYTEEQISILLDKTFLQLLLKLGLHLGSEIAPMYPRIPLFWTPDILFTIASRLGPIKKDKLKFTEEQLSASRSSCKYEAPKGMDCPDLPPLSSCCTLSSWLTAVQQNKDYYKAKAIKSTSFE